MSRGAMISVVLHVLVAVLLLVGIPFWRKPEEPPPDTTVAMVFDGAAAASMPPPAAMPAAADTPTPSPALPALEPQPEEPPPPVQQAETPAPAPDPPPPPPVQQAEMTPPTPTPAPMPVPPPPPPVAQVRPPRALPQRAAARASVNPPGAPGHAPAGQNAAGATSDANNGAAWMGRLKQWWDQHSFYPKEASLTDEGGSVKVHIVIAPDGQVVSIDVVQSSGLSVLDAAAVAVFRNARLPPSPSGVPGQPADVVVTLHYHSAASGG